MELQCQKSMWLILALMISFWMLVVNIGCQCAQFGDDLAMACLMQGLEMSFCLSGSAVWSSMWSSVWSSVQSWTDVGKAFRADFRFEPNLWETSLQSNAVSHWLGANLESALGICSVTWRIQIKVYYIQSCHISGQNYTIYSDGLTKINMICHFYALDYLECSLIDKIAK